MAAAVFHERRDQPTVDSKTTARLPEAIQTGLAMNFTFKWTRRQILDAIDLYRSDSAELKREHEALQCGRRIAKGDVDPRHLYAIVDWKSARPKGLIKRNGSVDIREALRVASTAREERTAVAVLCGLRGVGVPMASAILTAINQERYTIIDWRALKALSVERSQVTIDYYLEYLEYCRVKSARSRVCLRDLDRALWMLGGE
jgi:hypothetical protein